VKTVNNTAYYQALEIKSDASDDEIKRAYRKLARKFHPDVSDAEDAEERFKAMKEAYDCLKDPDKRAAYDHYGEHWKAAMEAGAETEGAGSHYTNRTWQAAQDQSSAGGNFDFGDIFDSMFNSRDDATFRNSYRAYGNRGEDVQARMQITIEDSFRGASRQIDYETIEFGNDGRPRASRRKLDVKIPKGVVAGQRIRLTGQGQPGFDGGDNGDLYVEIVFAPHPDFEVRGRDVYASLSIAPWQAALGDTVQVETLGGPVQAKIPPASSSGKVLRLKRRGLPGKAVGDHYVEIVIDMSGAETDEARGLYEQLRDLEMSDHTARV